MVPSSDCSVDPSARLVELGLKAIDFTICVRKDHNEEVQGKQRGNMKQVEKNGKRNNGAGTRECRLGLFVQ